MLDFLCAGRLLKDPVVRTGASGKPFTTALVAAAEKLAMHKAGDSIAVTGAAKLTVWQQNGETRRGLGVTAAAVMSVYELRKRRARVNGDEPDQGGDRG